MLKLYLIFLVIIRIQVSGHSQKSIEYDSAISKCRIDTFHATWNEHMVAITSLHIQDLEGAQLPHFNGTTLNGIQIDDAYFRGRVSVIHFWFKGCEPCLEEIPGLNALAEHFKNQDVNFLAIGHEQTNIIEEFSRQHPLNFSQLTEGRSVIDKAFKYKASYPATFIIDKNLRIIKAINSIVGMDNRTTKGRIKRKLIPIIDKEIRNQ